MEPELLVYLNPFLFLCSSGKNRKYIISSKTSEKYLVLCIIGEFSNKKAAHSIACTNKCGYTVIVLFCADRFILF